MLHEISETGGCHKNGRNESVNLSIIKPAYTTEEYVHISRHAEQIVRATTNQKQRGYFGIDLSTTAEDEAQ